MIGKKIMSTVTIIFDASPYPNQITMSGAIAKMGTAWEIIMRGKNHDFSGFE
ncbi:MAG: hypothetical protein ACD_46C00268G0009 [uncultured bacterium]|nr:MAG: hypothetical protein ACD_46C00268G0009 [uncultured bacterium]